MAAASVRQAARYFPVKSSAFRFEAGLHPFGTDFGNGQVDRLYFQIDSQQESYVAAKRRVVAETHHLEVASPSAQSTIGHVTDWIRGALRREHADQIDPEGRSFRQMAASIQEDLVILQRNESGADAAIAVDVSFPSDWRPERILGTDFRAIHGPVPGFAETDTQAKAMVRSMVERGPYVRFVWTLKADDVLDHHPDNGPFAPWRLDGHGFLRVERQITVPFAEFHAALFLIRTYIYPFHQLDSEQRRRLSLAIANMSDAAAAYKGFAHSREIIRSLLGD